MKGSEWCLWVLMSTDRRSWELTRMAAQGLGEKMVPWTAEDSVAGGQRQKGGCQGWNWGTPQKAVGGRAKDEPSFPGGAAEGCARWLCAVRATEAQTRVGEDGGDTAWVTEERGRGGGEAGGERGWGQGPATLLPSALAQWGAVGGLLGLRHPHLWPELPRQKKSLVHQLI